MVGIDHISIRVSNYEKSKAFYGGLFTFLGFEISDEYPSTIGWTNGKTRYWIAPAEGARSIASAMSAFTIMHSSCAAGATSMRSRAIWKDRAFASSIRPTNITRTTTPSSSSIPMG